MNFIMYILLFFVLNAIMSFSPGLGMILYIAFIVYIFSSSKKRMHSYQQRSYEQKTYTNTQQQNTNSNQQYANANDKNEKKVKDAIDVEFTEEEIH